MLIAARGRTLAAVEKAVAVMPVVAMVAALKRAIACRVPIVVVLRRGAVSTEVARGRMPAVVVAAVFPGLAMVLRHVRPASVAAPAGQIWGAAGVVVARALAVDRVGEVVAQALAVAVAVAVVAVVASAAADAAVAVAVAASLNRFPFSPEKNTMKFMYMMKTLAMAVLITMAPAIDAAQPSPATRSVAQQGYATPEDAASALAEAVRAQDRQALLAVVGPASRSWLASGDPVADRAEWQRFLAAYDRKHAISPLSDGRAVLLVGDDDWSFPAPLVRKGERWFFDAAAGREEILNRRIGRNELDTIQTLLAVVDAQREYAAKDLDGNGWNDYARRFVSSEGARDGLFWPVEADQPPSPLGPLLAAATREGYYGGGQPQPYHGYRYRMLTGQGRDAPGGAYGYLLDDRMIGGFAVVAYPAKYGVSGVMTFIVNHDGRVFQKNLGKNTEAAVARLRTFNPDASWAAIE